MDQFDKTAQASRLKMHVFRIWAHRLQDDEVFEESNRDGNDPTDIKSASEDLSSPMPKQTDVVSEDNLVEFMEALDIQNFVTEQELLEII